MGKHGSDFGVYDFHGRFVPLKFEEIFHKLAKTNPEALTVDELDEFLKGNREPKDYGGWLDWRSHRMKTLYYLAKDKTGLLEKDTIKAVYDGSLFEKMAAETAKKKHKGTLALAYEEDGTLDYLKLLGWYGCVF